MKNVSRECKLDERVQILDRFMAKMARSKHNEKTRSEVLKAGLRGYFKMVGNVLMGFSKVNRPADMGRREREIRKILGPTEWFQPVQKCFLKRRRKWR